MRTLTVILNAAERSEGSIVCWKEILRFTQDDIFHTPTPTRYNQMRLLHYNIFSLKITYDNRYFVAGLN
jgi:hypothetical protein